MMVRGYRLDVYQRAVMAADFMLDKLPDYAPYAVMNGITAEIQTKLNACPDAERVGYVRYSEEYHEMEPHLYQVWEQIAQERLSGQWLERWEQMKEKNQMKITLIGIDKGGVHMGGVFARGGGFGGQSASGGAGCAQLSGGR